jgi:alpha-1,3-glucosyltransferase
VFSNPTGSSTPAAATAAAPSLQQQRRQLFVLAAVLLQPASIIVDHGHFQYNCISLGLTVLAAVAIAKRKDVLGSMLFCLSLNHKQMGLFYAPAFFAHLLGRCLQQPTLTAKVGYVYSTAMSAACAWQLPYAAPALHPAKPAAAAAESP